MKRIAFYGGSFDPVHNGHLAVAQSLMVQFSLDEFVFIPAYHAPHKSRKRPTSAYDRYAMLCLATDHDERITVSKMEIEAPERPFTVETLTTLNARLSDTQIFFVMGADSWMDITTWREWESVLSLSNHIVVTRPGNKIAFDHVTDEIRKRIIDLREGANKYVASEISTRQIYITDAVFMDISATDIRGRIHSGEPSWRNDVLPEVAKHIEKYQIYS
ncbi:MAG TPA: nicotinate-nucleotide adenylyltransferase [Pyrinomonadaceae bacterium]|nr:nicotinate (nicotinamide) nucleotide adenylyltransferase [Chloracidobacterium sp.]MBP9936646.1 nicotinate-nucleotide adenylyltransferase [Pyrinomonadaceae bacterium]MBK9437203.1 nicotinate (nicotinamide) nucleotide adenylyltransferase [Chloracidobacterium sp.]MBK9765934.1 nicotinate (nicotinamide) nucleotide adenylyltransferase [Chloracidobacterium sp.]MBL0239876.1 nicotinate (nicotinamide) nucleotide adenylyltransferase [Chloracidobacterium sp.]